MLTILGVVAMVAAATVAAIGFHRRILREIDALLSAARPVDPQPIREADLQRLPAPVQQWLRYSRVVGSRPPTTVRLRQRGDFNLGRGWMPFTADQYFTIDPPGFVWVARFRMAAVLSVFGRDAYRDGVASMDMRVLSLIPVAKKTGNGLNQGDLLRFLGEMQWFPGAVLSRYVTWAAIDETSARATMQYGGIAASMTFKFASGGRLLESSAVRYNDARGANEMWSNRNDSDGEFGSVRLPATGEARWEYTTGPFPYIRWTITSIEQDRPFRYTK